MNDGMPIVHMLTSVSCDGDSGYGSENMSVTVAKTSEKMFLTRYSDAERSMLFMTRLPSATTAGIAEKSESSSTMFAT